MAKKRASGKGCLYRLRDGRWRGQVYLGPTKPRYKIAEGRTKEVVQAKIAEILRLKSCGVDVNSGDVTLAQFLERWLVDRVQRRVRSSTFESYSMIVRLHIVPILGHIELGKVTADQIQQLLNRKQDEGLSVRSVRYIHSVLRSALKQATRSRLLEWNVSEAVDLPRLKRFKVEPYTPEEARRFLEAVQIDRLHALYVLAISTGMRAGELLALQWGDLDLKSGVVRIDHNLRRTEGKLQLSDTKSDSSRRSQPLPQIALEALLTHRTAQDQERLLMGSKWKQTGFVFTTTVGTPLDGCNLSNRFRKLLVARKLRVIRFHDLRHTAASLLINSGDGPRHVMEMLGHSQISITMDLYGHIFESTKRESARKMDEALRGITTATTTAQASSTVN
jgi:integrase